MNTLSTDWIIARALREDAYQQDITTKFLIRRDQLAEAYIVVKEQAIIKINIMEKKADIINDAMNDLDEFLNELKGR